MRKEYKALVAKITAYGEPGAVVAFSGGADSTLVCRACIDAGMEITAVLFQTVLHPAVDEENADRVAKELGISLVKLSVDEFSDADIINNPIDRCYRCKHLLFRTLREYAKRRKINLILDGTNADDLGEYRPGLRALKELGVHSPIAEIGMDKQTVRSCLGDFGISVSNRPSTPCLATRFPYGTTLTEENLRRVEEAENWLHTLGFTQLRVRVHDNIARLECTPEQFVLACEKAKEITAKLHGFGYDYITLDLEGFRSGSMDLFPETD